MFEDLFTFIDSIITNNIHNLTGVFTSAILPFIGACVTLYLVYLAFQILYQPDNLIVMDVVKTIGSLAAVTSVGLSTSYYLDNIVPFVLHSGDDIAQALLGHQSGGSASLQTMVDTILSQIEAMWKHVHFDFTSSASWTTSMTFVTMIFLTILGALPFIAVATAYLLIAKLSVSFLLILGPMFIMMAFFPTTRGMFQQWTGQCFNYILMMIMFPLAFSMFTQVLNDTVFAQNITFAKSLMVFIVFWAMVLLSVQIPALCSALSGGASIHGLMGNAFSTGSSMRQGAGTATKPARSAGKWVGKKALGRVQSALGKDNIKPG